MRSKRLHSYSSTLSPSSVYKNGNAGESCSWSTGINQVVHCNVHIKKLPIARLSVVWCSWSKASGGFYMCAGLKVRVSVTPVVGYSVASIIRVPEIILCGTDCSLVDCTRGKGAVKYSRKKGSLLKKRLKPDHFWKKMRYQGKCAITPWPGIAVEV